MTPSIHTKAILKTTPFGLINSGEASPSINGKTLEDTQQTTKVFPFGMPTYCNEQMESHTTTNPKQNILLEVWHQVFPSEGPT